MLMSDRGDSPSKWDTMRRSWIEVLVGEGYRWKQYLLSCKWWAVRVSTCTAGGFAVGGLLGKSILRVSPGGNLMFASMSKLGSSSLGLCKEDKFTEVTEEEGESWGMETMSFMLPLKDWEVCTSVVQRLSDWHRRCAFKVRPKLEAAQLRR